MATIRELYQKAGSPNLTHWKDIKILSIAEASLLTCAINPIDYEFGYNNNIVFQLKHKKPINWMDCLMMMRALVEAVATQELKSPLIVLERENDYGNYIESIEQSRVGIDDIDTMSYPKTKIHREELKAWLKKNDYIELTQQAEIQVNQVQPYHQETTNQNDVILLPEPTYTTPALDALYGVIDEFWKNYDPNNNQPPPKQSTVASWIKANYPDIQTSDICTYIDKICRHPTAKKGGNTKLNQSNKMKDITPIK